MTTKSEDLTEAAVEETAESTESTEAVEDAAETAPEKAAGDTEAAEKEAPAEKAEDGASEASEASEKETPAEEAVEKKTADEKPGKAGAASRLPSGRVLLVAVLAVLLVTTSVTAFLQWREAGRLSDAADTEQLVRTRSAEFGQALLAYRHTDLDDSRERIRSLSSADFGQSYETAFDGLAEVIKKYEADATATVRDIYVNEIDGQRAKSLVVLDTEVKSTAGVRRVLGTKLLLELILEKGSWKVNSLATLAADDESLTKPDGTTEKADPSAGSNGETANP